MLFIIEVCIALFLHDRIIRPYMGDLLVVILLYCLVKSFLKLRPMPAALAVLAFAYLIEILQYFQIVEVLGLQHSKLARVVIGTSFEWIDMLAYTMGIGIVLWWENRKKTDIQANEAEETADKQEQALITQPTLAHDNISDTLMFEIHLTTHALLPHELDAFVAFCASIEAKPILIELDKGEIPQQPMISKTVHSEDPAVLHETLQQLKTTFEQAGYPIVREKVEVPAQHYQNGKTAFPDYRGGYFEWHGKVRFKKPEQLQVLQSKNMHISKSSLKGESDTRFVTHRTSDRGSFYLAARNLRLNLEAQGLEIVKEEYEYCIFDSNKTVDHGWVNTPDITDTAYLTLLAFEGFLRRASRHDAPFALKGSLVTRQYLADKTCRNAMDIDFIYENKVYRDQPPNAVFSEWVTQVTETYVNDNVDFRSFRENDFWRGIDYAMNDDFPTTSTDLSCIIEGTMPLRFGLDISWNLPLEDPFVPLLYHPVVGEPFILSRTVPLSLQLSWKLHQTVVRPRAKDMFDVILLLQANPLESAVRDRVLYHFIAECNKDHINPLRLNEFTEKKVSALYREHQEEIEARTKKDMGFNTPFGFYFIPDSILDNLSLEFNMEIPYLDTLELIDHFENTLIEAGLIVP